MTQWLVALIAAVLMLGMASAEDIPATESPVLQWEIQQGTWPDGETQEIRIRILGRHLQIRTEMADTPGPPLQRDENAVPIPICENFCIQPPPPPDPVEATLIVLPEVIDAGQTVTLSWGSSGATSCEASGAWSGSLALEGTRASDPLTADAVFGVTCDGPGGSSTASRSVVVVQPPPPPPPIVSKPKVMIKATPFIITAGGTSTLTWASWDAERCEGQALVLRDRAWVDAPSPFNGPRPPNGSMAVSPTETTGYRFACVNVLGTVSIATTVGVQ